MSIVRIESNGPRELTVEEKQEIEEAKESPIIADDDCPMYSFEELQKMHSNRKSKHAALRLNVCKENSDNEKKPENKTI
jgi:hypothetical protein